MQSPKLKFRTPQPYRVNLEVLWGGLTAKVNLFRELKSVFMKLLGYHPMCLSNRSVRWRASFASLTHHSNPQWYAAPYFTFSPPTLCSILVLLERGQI